MIKMKKTDIERIIKQGSTKQKIKLYFTDVAYFNTKNMDQVDNILTSKEREIIFNSIKDSKDIKYWEELRIWNKAFMMFKPNVTTYTKNFDYLTATLSTYIIVNLLHKEYENTINDILEVVEDKKLREKLVETTLKSLQKFNGQKYQKNFISPLIKIPEENMEFIIQNINEEIKVAKEYIAGIKIFTYKYLPLQPYKEFLIKAENKIKEEIEFCRKLIEDFIERKKTETLIGKVIKVTKGLELPDERFTITRWEDVEVDITDEDIEDIKSAGR